MSASRASISTGKRFGVAFGASWAHEGYYDGADARYFRATIIALAAFGHDRDHPVLVDLESTIAMAERPIRSILASACWAIRRPCPRSHRAGIWLLDGMGGFAIGSAAELISSGAIGQAFDSPDVRFSAKRGRFELVEGR